MSVTLTNPEKQARYRERHLGVDGEKARVGLNAGTRAKNEPPCTPRGYTITDLVEELVEREASSPREDTLELIARTFGVPTGICSPLRSAGKRNSPRDDASSHRSSQPASPAFFPELESTLHGNSVMPTSETTNTRRLN
jgi:hypothetical protein